MVNAFSKQSLNLVVVGLLVGTLISQPAWAQPATGDKMSEKPAGFVQRYHRLAHAQELLGKHYTHSVARSGERIRKINYLIYGWTRDRLPKKYRSQYKEIAQTIIDQSLAYKLDPVLLMSVIQGESSFKPRMVGKVGEIGLMQIRPTTGKWIASMHGIPWKGKKSLYDPITNIRIGAAFLNYLRDQFDMHAQLYLAAYNMGQGNVKDALIRKVWPKEYPVHVMKYYVEFYAEIKERESQEKT